MTALVLLAAEATQQADDTLVVVLVTSVFTFLGLLVTSYFGYLAVKAGKAAKETATEARTEATQLRADIATNHGRTPGQHLEAVFDVQHAVADVRKAVQDAQHTQDVLRHEMDEIRLDVRALSRLLRVQLGHETAGDELTPEFVCRRRRCPGDCGGIHNPRS